MTPRPGRLVVPRARPLEAFAPQGAAQVLIAALGDAAAVRVPRFEGIECPPAALWPE